MILTKNLLKNTFFQKNLLKQKNIPCIFSFSEINPQKTNEGELKNLSEKQKPKYGRFSQSRLLRIYEFSKKMNVLRYFRKEIDEQKMIHFLRRVQGLTLMGIYEAVSLSYLFNFLDIFRTNIIYSCGGGILVAFGCLHFLKKNQGANSNKFIKFVLYQGLIVSLSMSFTPALMAISNPVVLPAIYIISGSAYFTSQISNYYFSKQRMALPIATFAGGVVSSFLVLYGISYSTFVAVGNNPFVGAYGNFWIKNEVYLLNAIFALNTNSAIKSFKKGENDSMSIALNFYLGFIKRIAGILSYLLGKLKNK